MKRALKISKGFHTFNVFSLLVYYLREGFKAYWFTTLEKASRHTGLLP